MNADNDRPGDREHRLSSADKIADSPLSEESKIAESTVRDSPQEPVDVSELEDITDCLHLIDRVRETLPECLADLQSSDGGEMWLSGEGDHPPQIGRFQIRRKLGEGGFGLVFLAHDEALDREVALKVPRVETLVTEATRQRFLREGKAAGALNHNNIAAVYESGRFGPICYIATAYCGGGSLGDWLRENGHSTEPCVSPSEAACIIRQLAEAIQHAHGRGILHRDLKPANVLLSEQVRPSSEQGGELSRNARIVDFGLAKSLDSVDECTRTGAVLGTPSFMSPEQAMGDVRRIGPASDIYSLGALLYELLTGKPPFKGESDAETILAVTHQEPTPPRRRQPSCPRDLEAICLKCLEKEPQSRYASATELSADLDRFLKGEAVQASPITAAQRWLRWSRRNPAMSALSFSAVALLAALAGVSTDGYRRTSRALADKSAALEQVDQSRVETLQQFELARRAIDEFLVSVNDDPRLKSKALQPLRRSLLEQSRKFYQELTRKRPDDPRLKSEYAFAISRLALLNQQLGDFEAASSGYEESIEIFTQLAKEVPNSPSILNRLGRCHLDYGTMHFRNQEHEKLLQPWNAAIEVYDRLARLAHLASYQKIEMSILQNRGSAYKNRGMFHILRQEFDEAERFYLRAMELRKQLAEKFPDDTDNLGLLANTHVNLGLLYRQNGDLEKETTHLERAVQALESAIAKKPIDSVSLRTDLADDRLHLAHVYDKRNRRDDQVRQRKLAVAELEQLCKDQPLIPRFKVQLATLFQGISVDSKDSPQSRLDARQKAIELVRKLEQDHPEYPLGFLLPFTLVLNEGADLRKVGDIEGSDRKFAAAIAICEAELKRNPSNATPAMSKADALFCIGYNHRNDDDATESLAYFSQSIELLDKLLEDAPKWKQGQTLLGRVHDSRAHLLVRIERDGDAHADFLAAADLGFRPKRKDKIIELTAKIGADPQDSRALRDRGLGWFYRKDYDQAIRDCTRSIALDPKPSPAYTTRAWSHICSYQFPEAIADYEASVQRTPNDAWVCRDLAWLYAVAEPKWRNPDRSLQLAQLALHHASKDPQKQIALSTLGVAHYRLGEYQKALEAFGRMKPDQPHVESLFFQSLCQHHLGNTSQAAASYRQAIRVRDDGYRPIPGELDDMSRYLDQLQADVRRQVIGEAPQDRT